jgi:hypothetical protein
MESTAFQEILVQKFTVCKVLSGHETGPARLSVNIVRKLRYFPPAQVSGVEFFAVLYVKYAYSTATAAL